MEADDMLCSEFSDFLKKMDRLKVPYSSEIVPGFAHEWAFWDMEIVRFLDWPPRTDYYQEAPKRKI